MTDAPEPESLPPSLHLLKWLVIGLTASMIGGVIAVVWLLVTRLPIPQTGPSLPPELAMPAGARAQAVTMGIGWIGVVTTDNRLLVFNADGTLRQEIDILGATGG
jgi:Flp pilus assembly protein protease CpaA